MSVTSAIFDHWRHEMSNSDLIRTYLSAYENKDRKTSIDQPLRQSIRLLRLGMNPGNCSEHTERIPK
jgi:hypothetical protein